MNEMTELKHTPVPWIIIEKSNEWAAIVADQSTDVGFVDVWNFYGDKDRLKSDARLIAAAPELLDALLDCREALRRTGHDGELAIVNAAIAKATGGKA